MSGTRPERVLDPVCGMTVEVAKAEEAGLTIEHDGRTYAFCRSGCLRAFQEEPSAYPAKAEQARFSGGRIGLRPPETGTKFGMLRLTTVERRSSQPRVAIVGYYEDGPIVIARDDQGRSWALRQSRTTRSVVTGTGAARMSRTGEVS